MKTIKASTTTITETVINGQSVVTIDIERASEHDNGLTVTTDRQEYHREIVTRRKPNAQALMLDTNGGVTLATH